MAMAAYTGAPNHLTHGLLLLASTVLLFNGAKFVFRNIESYINAQQVLYSSYFE